HEACQGAPARGPFVVEQPALRLRPEAIAADRAARADHTVARHDQRDRVGRVRHADGPGRARHAHTRSQVSVRHGLAGANLTQALPHRALEIGPGRRVGVDVFEGIDVAGEVGGERVVDSPRVAPGLAGRAEVERCLPDDGGLDDATEDDLATHLGVSARHLRRMFDEHVGATPNEVARSRRAHFARRLLDDTDLPIAQVGFAAGFRSVRHMNRVMKEVFAFTPQELRARRRRPDRLVTDGGLELRVAYRPPLAWKSILQFLAPRAIPGVEAVDLDAGVYR